MKNKILIIEKDKGLQDSFRQLLEKNGYEVRITEKEDDGIALLRNSRFNHVIFSLDNKDSGLSFLKKGVSLCPDGHFIATDSAGDVDIALEALSIGARDYIQKPPKDGQLLFTLRHGEEEGILTIENKILKEEIAQLYTFGELETSSPSLKEAFEIMQRASRYDAPVLITGESGIGKERVAKAIHYNSNRKYNSFTWVACNGLEDDLFEKEVFGEDGPVIKADGGTIFFDEVSNLSLPMQIKLLNLINERVIEHHSSGRVTRADIRVICATSKGLEGIIQKGDFKKELFYAIGVVKINLPPLREHIEDLPRLSEKFIKKCCKRHKMSPKKISKEAMEVMLNYSWPGNIRELENVIERAAIVSDDEYINKAALPSYIIEHVGAHEHIKSMDIDDMSLSIKKCSRALEIRLIQRALQATGWNKTQASKLLEISLPALIYKIKDYGISGSG